MTDLETLLGRAAIVFGGAKGIGQAYTATLLQHGYRVCCSDIDTLAGEIAVTELREIYGSNVIFAACDVRKETDIQSVFAVCRETFHDVNIVVNNCGAIQEFDWQFCIDVNLAANIRIVEKCLKEMGKHHGGKGGCFVATASCAGFLPQFWGPVYSATKHAVIAYVRSWALPENFTQHGIRMNCVCPYRVKTDFLQNISSDKMHHADAHLQDAQDHPEMLSPEKVAEALMMIINDESLQGQAVRVSLENGVDLEPYHLVPHPYR